MDILVQILISLGCAIPSTIAAAVYKYNINKRMKKRKREIEAIRQATGVLDDKPTTPQVNNDPYEMPQTNGDGEYVDLDNYVELETIKTMGNIEMKRYYNKVTQQIEILYSVPNTARPEPERPEAVPKLDFRK